MMKEYFLLIKRYFPNIVLAHHIYLLTQSLKTCTTILDIGCGSNSPIQHINSIKTGVDADTKAIGIAKKNKTHTYFIRGDIKNLSRLLNNKRYDGIAALDVIEHMKKKDGYKLLKTLDKIARKKIVIVTPNGFVRQIQKDNALQEHLSGWTVNDFKKYGYSVKEALGSKFLRGEENKLKFKPKIFWGIVSYLTQLFYTYSHPRSAASLVCIKHYE